MSTTSCPGASGWRRPTSRPSARTCCPVSRCTSTDMGATVTKPMSEAGSTGQFRLDSRGPVTKLVGIMLVLTAISTALFIHTLTTRLRRDVARLVLEDRLDVLDSARLRVDGSGQLLRDAEAAPEPPHDRPY